MCWKLTYVDLVALGFLVRVVVGHVGVPAVLLIRVLALLCAAEEARGSAGGLRVVARQLEVHDLR